jgi:hypothetical protein
MTTALVARQGVTFTQVLQYLDSNSDPVDLDGCSAEMHVRANADDAVTIISLGTVAGGIEFTVPAEGRIVITITDEDTALLPAGLFVYDLLVTRADGTVDEPLLEGTFRVIRTVTR